MQKQVCPECGSGKVTSVGSELSANPDFACAACSWSGSSADLMLVDASRALANLGLMGDTELALTETVAANLQTELRNRAGTEIVKSILAAGVVAKSDKYIVVRLLRAGVNACRTAILDEVTAIQEEMGDGSRN